MKQRALADAHFFLFSPRRPTDTRTTPRFPDADHCQGLSWRRLTGNCNTEAYQAPSACRKWGDY